MLPTLSAQRAYAKYGVPSSVTLAQYCLESDYGKHMPPGSNNPFGMKATGNDEFVACPTLEVYNGQTKRIVAHFKKYTSLDDAFEDHARLLANGKPYQKIKKYLSQPLVYVKKLTGLYATDPEYGDKLTEIINENNLTQYDIKVDKPASTVTKTIAIGTTGTVVAAATQQLPQHITHALSPDTVAILIACGFFGLGCLLMVLIAAFIHISSLSKKEEGDEMVLASYAPVIAAIQALQQASAASTAQITDLKNQLAAAESAANGAATDESDTLAAVAAAANVNTDGSAIVAPVS